MSNFGFRLQLQFYHRSAPAKTPIPPPVFRFKEKGKFMNVIVDLHEGTLLLTHFRKPASPSVLDGLKLDRQLQRLFMKRAQPGPDDFEEAKTDWETYTEAARDCARPYILLAWKLLRLLRETILRLRLPPSPVDPEPLLSWRIGDGPWRDIPPWVADEHPRSDVGRLLSTVEPLSKAEVDFLQSLLDSESLSFAPLHHLLRAVEEPLPHLRVLLAGLAAELSLKDALHRRTGIKHTETFFSLWSQKYRDVFGQTYPKLKEILALNSLRNKVIHKAMEFITAVEAAVHLRTAVRATAHTLSLNDSTAFLADAVLEELLPRVEEEYPDWHEPWWAYLDSEPGWMYELLPSVHFARRVKEVLPNGLCLVDSGSFDGYWSAKIANDPPATEPYSDPVTVLGGVKLTLQTICSPIVLDLDEAEEDLANEEYCNALLTKIEELSPVRSEKKHD